MTERLNDIINHMNSDDEESILKALEKAKNLKNPTKEEILDAAAALSTIFYHHGPAFITNLKRTINKTIKQIAHLGEDVIPFLFDEIINADAESAIQFGKTIAKMGDPAIDYILEHWHEYEEDDFALLNLVQALSYFKKGNISKAVPTMLKEVEHPNYQVSAMALYSVGKLAYDVKQKEFSDDLRSQMFESAFLKLKDRKHLVRKNAARTLGKMQRRGLLNKNQQQLVYQAFMSILGKDGRYKWDRAFIVRHEAEYFLQFFDFKPQVQGINRYRQTFKIISKEELCPNTFYFAIEAPLIARKIQAGQFIIVRPLEFSERIPLSVCGWDKDKGTVNIIVVSVGKTTTEINTLNEGDTFIDVVGPLGERSHVGIYPGTCVVIGGGYGAGAIIPTARDLKYIGNKVIGIVGARNEELLLLTDELAKVCDEIILTTNDGSKGLKGFVTDALAELVKRETVSHVLAVGPVPMMRAVSDLTRKEGIETYVSLNAIMVDATGMCGACRVSVGGETKFACFHGPDFDGHKVDFEELEKRQKMFVNQEKVAFESIQH